MSLLKNQLASLKLSEHQTSRAFHSNERPSVLFSFKEAASLSIEKIREMALEGFMQLSRTLPELNQFKSFLFERPELFHLDRNRLTETENDAIKTEVTSLLVLLSQDFSQLSTLKMIEYLLRNFEVHKFEGPKLVSTFMTHHSTAPFTKLLQNVDLTQPHSWLGWLEEPVISGRGFDRRFLVDKVLKNDLSLMGELLSLAEQYSKLRRLRAVKASPDGPIEYFVSKGPTAVTQEVELPCFRFYCVLCHELLSRHSHNEHLRWTLRTHFWRVLSWVVDEGQTGFLQGSMFLLTTFAMNKVLSFKETRVAIKDLLSHCFLLSETVQRDIMKVLLLLCSFEGFKVTRAVTACFTDSLCSALQSTSKNHSVIPMTIVLTAFVHKQLTKDRQLSPNVLTATCTALSTVVEHLDRFSNLHSLNTRLLSSLSTLLRLLLQSATEQTSSVVKSIKQSIQTNSSFVTQVVKLVFSNPPQSKDDYRLFKATFKQHFGDPLLFGIVDQSDFSFDNLQTGKVNQGSFFMDLRCCADSAKLTFLSKLKHELQSKERVVKRVDRQKYASVFEELLVEEHSLRVAFMYIEVVALLTDSPTTLAQARENLIDKLMRHNAVTLMSEDADFVVPFLAVDDGSVPNTVFCRVFKAFLSLLSKNKPEVDQWLGHSLFEISYDRLLQILRFFGSANQSSGVCLFVLNACRTHLHTRLLNQQPPTEQTIKAIATTFALLRVFSGLLANADFQTELTAVVSSVSSLLSHPATEHAPFRHEVFGHLSEFISGMSREVRQQLLTNDRSLVSHFELMVQLFVDTKVQKISLKKVQFLMFLFENSSVECSNQFYKMMTRLFLKVIAEIAFCGQLFERKEAVHCSLFLVLKMAQAYNHHLVNSLGKRSAKVSFLKSIVKSILADKDRISWEDKQGFLKGVKSVFAKQTVAEKRAKTTQEKSQINLLFKHLLADATSGAFHGEVKDEFLTAVLMLARETQSEVCERVVKSILSQHLHSQSHPLLSSSVAVCLLKLSDYDSFLELARTVAQNGAENRTVFLAQIKRDLTTAQDIVKLVTLIEFVVHDKAFDLSGIKLSVEEYLVLFSCLFSMSSVSQPITLNCQHELAVTFAFTLSRMRMSPAVLTNCVYIYHVCWSFLLSAAVATPLAGFALRIADSCFAEIIKAEPFVKVVKTEIKREFSAEQPESRSLKIASVCQRFGVDHPVDFGFDFDCSTDQKARVSVKRLCGGSVAAVANWAVGVLRCERSGAVCEGFGFKEALLGFTKLCLLFIEAHDQQAFDDSIAGLIVIADCVGQGSNRDDFGSVKKVFFDQWVWLASQLAKSNIQNRYLKLFEMSRQLLQEHSRANDSSMVKCLNQLTSRSKIFLQLANINDGSFSSSLDLIACINDQVLSHDHSFILVVALLTNLCDSQCTVDDSLLALFCFKVLKRLSQRQPGEAHQQSLADVLASLSKLLFGLQCTLTPVLGLLQNVEKQLIHGVRQLSRSAQLRMSRVCCLFFDSAINDKHTLRVITDTPLQPQSPTPLCDFLLFIVLNQISPKRKSTNDSSQQPNSLLFQRVKLSFIKRLSHELLIDFLIDLPHRITFDSLRLSVMNHLLNLTIAKFSSFALSKSLRSNLAKLVDVLCSQTAFKFTFKDKEVLKNQVKFVRKTVSLFRVLMTHDSPFTLRLLLNAPDFPKQWLLLVNRIDDLPAQLDIYRLVTAVARTKEDGFLEAFNNVAQNLLSFVQVHLPLLAHDQQSLETLAVAFVESFENLVVGFGSMVEPFLKDLFLVCAELLRLKDSLKHSVMALMDLIASLTDFRIALKHVEEAIECAKANGTPELFEMASLFTLKTFKQINSDTFAEKNKSLFGLISKSADLVFELPLTQSMQHTLSATWAEVFVAFALKCNESQLKNHFSTFVRQSSKLKNTRIAGGRKELTLLIFKRLTETLGPFSIVLYGEVFESCLEVMEEANRRGSGHQGTKGKKPILGDESHQLDALTHVLSSLANLLKNDQSSFFDSFKFDQVFAPLLRHFKFLRFGSDRDRLVGYFHQSVIPVVVNLLLLANDELKTKTVINELLSRCVNDDKTTKLLSIEAIKRVLGAVNQGFSAHLHEVVLKLSNFANDPDVEVADAVGGVVKLVEELTGEGIKDILLREDVNFEA